MSDFNEHYCGHCGMSHEGACVQLSQVDSDAWLVTIDGTDLVGIVQRGSEWAVIAWPDGEQAVDVFSRAAFYCSECQQYHERTPEPCTYDGRV